MLNRCQNSLSWTLPRGESQGNPKLSPVPRSSPASSPIPAMWGDQGGGSQHCWEKQEPRGDAGRKSKESSKRASTSHLLLTVGSAAGKSPSQIAIMATDTLRPGASPPTGVLKSPSGGMRSIPLVMGLKGTWGEGRGPGHSPALSLRGTRCWVPPQPLSLPRCFLRHSPGSDAFPLWTRRDGAG